MIIYIVNQNNHGIDRKKNHYTQVREKFRNSARLSRSFGGKFGGKNG